MLIPISAIADLRAKNRRGVDEYALEQLIASIQAHGLIQPIAVREIVPGTYELMAGARRILAHQRLGLTEIEANVMTYKGKVLPVALAENVRRLNLSPVEESDIVQSMHDEAGMSIADICDETRHGTSWVQDRLAVSKMPEKFKAALHAKALSIGAAMQLLLIDDAEYRDYLLHIAKTNGATIHQCEAWLLDYQARKRLTNPDGTYTEIPQPPPLTSGPPQPCAFCDELIDRETIILVRVCRTCLDDLQRAKLSPNDHGEIVSPGRSEDRGPS